MSKWFRPLSCWKNSRVNRPDLVQMALEIGDAGDDAIAAAYQLTLDGHAAQALHWIATAEASNATRLLTASVASPAALRIVLLQESPDITAARALLPVATQAAIPALLDVLASSNVRAIRRLVIDRLREFGPTLWNELLDRLDDTTWFFARNLLVLMRDIRADVRAAGGDLSALPIVGVARYLSHDRDQLRLEAVRLLLDDPAMRDGALRRAFDDAHPRILREALEWIIAGSSSRASTIPAEFQSKTIAIIENRRVSDEIRARAVWALEAHHGPTVLQWLTAHVSRKRLFFRRAKIADSSPTVLAALGLLARRYATEPHVATILLMARATGDLRSQAVGRAAP